MKPVKVYKAGVDIEDLLNLSEKYLVKATDGKSMIIVQGRKIVATRGDPPEHKKEMVIALYSAQKRIKLDNIEYSVNKIETRISNSVKEDLEKIAQSHSHVVVGAFSKRLKRVYIVYRNGNLVYCNGNYNQLLKESRAILDIYRVLREEASVTREEVLKRLKLKEPTEEEIDMIIQHAFGDEVGGYYST